MNKYRIDDKVNIMYAESVGGDCECCGHPTAIIGEKKVTIGIVEEIRIDKNGYSYVISGLHSRYKDTKYIYDEIEILGVEK